jgi:hypothetical protein
VDVEIEPQPEALNTSTYVFELVAVFPLSIVTVTVVVIALAGKVILYQTSLVVPHELVAIPSFVAKYKSPLVVTQLVPGVSVVTDEQLLLVGCENTICEMKTKKQRLIVLAARFMVFRFGH